MRPYGPRQATPPLVENQRKDPRGWRPHASKDPINQGETQTLPALGRTLYGDRSDPTERLPTEGRQRQRSHQYLEHRTVTSFLPLKIQSYRFLSFTVCSYKAPWPKHFRLGSLGGSTRVQYHLSFFYYHMVNTFYLDERVVYSLNYPT